MNRWWGALADGSITGFGCGLDPIDIGYWTPGRLFLLSSAVLCSLFGGCTIICFLYRFPMMPRFGFMGIPTFFGGAKWTDVRPNGRPLRLPQEVGSVI